MVNHLVSCGNIKQVSFAPIMESILDGCIYLRITRVSKIPNFRLASSSKQLGVNSLILEDYGILKVI